MNLMCWLLLMMCVLIVHAEAVEPKVYSVLQLLLPDTNANIKLLKPGDSDHNYKQCKTISTAYIRTCKNRVPVQHQLYEVTKEAYQDTSCIPTNVDIFCAMHLSEEYIAASLAVATFVPPKFLKHLPSPYYFPPGRSTSIFEIVGVQSQRWHLRAEQVTILNFLKNLKGFNNVKKNIFYCPLLLHVEKKSSNGTIVNFSLLNYHRYGGKTFELLRQLSGSIAIYGFRNSVALLTWHFSKGKTDLNLTFREVVQWGEPIENAILFRGIGDNIVKVEFFGIEKPNDNVWQNIKQILDPLFRQPSDHKLKPK